MILQDVMSCCVVDRYEEHSWVTLYSRHQHLSKDKNSNLLRETGSFLPVLHHISTTAHMDHNTLVLLNIYLQTFSAGIYKTIYKL